MSIFPPLVRHVSPSRDVWIRLTAKYLHINIFDQNLKKVWIFCVSFLYKPCSCKVSPLFGDHRLQRAGRGSKRFMGPRQCSHWRETEQQTRGFNQDCYVSKNPKMCRQMPYVRKSVFSYWYRNLLFFKISHSAHSDKMLLLWIVLLDHLILNCMELLTSFSCRDCALIMADIPIDRFALSGTLVPILGQKWGGVGWGRNIYLVLALLTLQTTKVSYIFWNKPLSFITWGIHG